MTEITNYSEFATLARCERQWAYGYVLGEEENGARAGLHLGTLLHKGHEQWMLGNGATLPRTWADDISAGGKPGEERTYSLEDFDPELVERATWLLTRWASHYGSEPPSHWNVISTEGWLTADTSWGQLVGRTDGIIEIDGELWFNEVKSYGAKGRLDYVPVDPQLGIYDILVEATYGKPAFGIIYDGIYTYQWVPKQRTLKVIEDELRGASRSHPAVGPGPRLLPLASSKWLRETAKEIQASEPGIERDPSESFERLELDLSDAHRSTTAQYLSNAVWRRSHLTQMGQGVARLPEETMALTIPNVGRDCGWCGFKVRCWSELGGVEPDDIEIEDESAEPV